MVRKKPTRIFSSDEENSMDMMEQSYYNYENDDDDDFNPFEDIKENPPPLLSSSLSNKQSDNKNIGKICLTIPEYIKLKKQIKEIEKNKPPINYTITNIKLKGETKGKLDKCCFFNITIEFQQLYNEWTKIDLIPITNVILESSITFNDLSLSNNNSDNLIEAKLGIYNNYHCIFVQQQGFYSIDIHVKIPFISSHSKGIEIKIPKSVTSNLEFIIYQNDLEITAIPSLGSILSYNTEESNTNKIYSKLECDIPSTNSLTIQWKDKIEDNIPENIDEIEKQVIVNVEQYTIHSIGEGIVQSSSYINYRIVHGSRASFEIVIPSTTRILSVDGEAIKRWDVIINEKKQESLEDNNDINDMDNIIHSNIRKDCKVLKIWLDYSIEDNYKLILYTETDMESTSCDVIVPTISCNNITREKGFISIEARTNVEISTIQEIGISRISYDEIPHDIKINSSNPPLLSFKFLLANSTLLNIQVKKHEDAEVLIASIESAHLEASLAEDKILYKFTLQVRNTQTQYVRLKLPNNSSVWSTMVGTRAVKPAIDLEDFIMIPLEKSQSLDDKQHEAFIVEIVYLTKLPTRITKKGKLTLSICPIVDIPINHLFVTLKLPKNYKYSEFSGDLEEINYFSGTPPNSNDIIPLQQIQQNFEIKKNSNSNSLVSGILPVKVIMPCGGKPFYFEKLLVIEESYTVSVNYKKITKVLRQSNTKKRIIQIIICFLIIIILYNIIF